MNGLRVTTENLHQALHNEIRNLQSGEEWTRWLDGAAAFGNYSFRNVVLIALQMPYASKVASADVWKKLGRLVADNQRRRDIRVLAPKIVQGGRLIGYRVDSVWDISQTKGSHTPRLAGAPMSGVVPQGLWEALEHQVHSAGFTLVGGNTPHRGIDGFTNYTTKTVVVRNGLDDVTAVSRLAHEVAHLRLHDQKARKAANGAMCQGIREVEAESVAYILLRHHGVPTDGSSFEYVAKWAATVDGREPEKVVEQTGSRVVFAARKLIESTERRLGKSEAHRVRSIPPDSQTVELLTRAHDVGHRGPAV